MFSLMFTYVYTWALGGSCVSQRWNRSGFFMTGTGTGPNKSDRTGPAGLSVRPVDR